MITLSVEFEQEEDGRWIAEVTELPGVLAYGDNPEDARAKAQALASEWLRIVLNTARLALTFSASHSKPHE